MISLFFSNVYYKRELITVIALLPGITMKPELRICRLKSEIASSRDRLLYYCSLLE
jgi:hypothetical protein